MSCPHSPLLLFFFLIVLADTVPEKQFFDILLGSFGPDVFLVNISFPAGVLSVEECNTRGFNLMEHPLPGRSLKSFSLQIPFADPHVLQMASFSFFFLKKKAPCFPSNTLFISTTERKGHDRLLSSHDFWPLGLARVRSIFSHGYSESENACRRYVASLTPFTRSERADTGRVFVQFRPPSPAAATTTTSTSS